MTGWSTRGGLSELQDPDPTLSEHTRIHGESQRYQGPAKFSSRVLKPSSQDPDTVVMRRVSERLGLVGSFSLGHSSPPLPFCGPKRLFLYLTFLPRTPTLFGERTKYPCRFGFPALSRPLRGTGTTGWPRLKSGICHGRRRFGRPPGAPRRRFP